MSIASRPAAPAPRPAPPSWRSAAALLGACLLLSGCGRDAGAADLSAEQFVTVYTELRHAERVAADAGDFQSRKSDILARHDTSEEELMAFVAAHEEDVGFMAQVWDSVQARLQAPPDGVRAPSESPPEGAHAVP
ncbi:MAG TPA: hypothetical protein VMK65_05400, partial [Longimicrobiales bacterium]|nr:hypothetical protein [Longimicrobiales bacterium]